MTEIKEKHNKASLITVGCGLFMTPPPPCIRKTSVLGLYNWLKCIIKIMASNNYENYIIKESNEEKITIQFFLKVRQMHDFSKSGSV